MVPMFAVPAATYVGPPSPKETLLPTPVKVTMSGIAPSFGVAVKVPEVVVFDTHRGASWHPSEPYPPPTRVSFELHSGGMYCGQFNGVVSFPTTTLALADAPPALLEAVNLGMYVPADPYTCVNDAEVWRLLAEARLVIPANASRASSPNTTE